MLYEKPQMNSHINSPHMYKPSYGYTTFTLTYPYTQRNATTKHGIETNFD